MLSLFNKQNESLGYKISSDALPSDIEAVKGNIIKTNKKVRDEISKYREIARFNQQLSNGYIRNLEAMVDVSRVLNYYVEIFNVIKDEYKRNDEILGNSALKTDDIAYLEKLTRNKIDDINQKFLTETEKLKKLYTQYNKQAELSKVIEAQESISRTTNSANTAFETINRIELESKKEGGANKKVVRKKNTPAKKNGPAKKVA